MNLIYDNYIQFLKDKNVVIDDLKEGYYWLDRQIIKCYDKQGNIHKVARLYTDDKLNITYKLYKNKSFKIESWQGTVNRNINRLQELEIKSIKLICSMFKKYKWHKHIILTSGGKDSSVVLDLVRSINPNTKAIFNNTTLDCADTYKHIKTIENITTLTPKEGFYQWRKRLDFVPTRFSRACCNLFKEGETINTLDKNKKYLFFLGMRNEESSTRSSYQDEWRNEKWGNRDWQGCLPIREWTEQDIWLYILWKGLDFNSKYKKGYSRVGCAVACPYYGKSTWVLDQYWYPTLFNRWQQILHNDFVGNYKWTRMNCTLDEYMTNWNGGLVREELTQEVVTEFSEYKGINQDVAERYFNHECLSCGKKVNSKDEIAMNLKFLGRNTQNFYCKKHLIEYLNIDKKQWNEYIKDFKKDGCDLF